MLFGRESLYYLPQLGFLVFWVKFDTSISVIKNFEFNREDSHSISYVSVISLFF